MQNRHRRNLNSAEKNLNKVASGLFRWASTDHSGYSQLQRIMPMIGFLDSIKYTFVYFLIALFGIVLQLAWWYFFIAYGIPLLLFGHL